MSESRLRIPQVALATLVLGSGGCGGGDSGGGSGAGGAAGTNTSKARISSVVKAVCKWNVKCDEDDEEAESEADCVAEGTSFFEEAVEEDAACADALLDYYACYATLACDVEDDASTKCDALGKATDDLCPVDDDDIDTGRRKRKVR